MQEFVRTPGGLYLPQEKTEAEPQSRYEPPPRITSCPDCGAQMEAGEEHETRYTMRCAACCKQFTYKTGWLVLSHANTLVSVRKETRKSS